VEKCHCFVFVPASMSRGTKLMKRLDTEVSVIVPHRPEILLVKAPG